MKKFKDIVQSQVEPDKNSLWLSNNGLKYYGKNGWKPINPVVPGGQGGGESSGSDIYNVPLTFSFEEGEQQEDYLIQQGELDSNTAKEIIQANKDNKIVKLKFKADESSGISIVLNSIYYSNEDIGEFAMWEGAYIPETTDIMSIKFYVFKEESNTYTYVLTVHTRQEEGGSEEDSSNEKIIKINGKGSLTNFYIGPYNDYNLHEDNYYQGYRTNIFSKNYPNEDFPTSMIAVRRGLSYEPGHYKIVLEADEGDIDIAKIYIPEYNTNNNHNFDILVTPISNNRYYIITGYGFIMADSEESIFSTDADFYILDIEHSKVYDSFTRQLPNIGYEYKSFKMPVTYSTSWAMAYSEFTAYKNDYYKYMINWYQYTNKREFNNNYFHDMLSNIDKSAEELSEILPSATCDTIDYTLTYARMDTSLACQDIGLIELQRRYFFIPEAGPRVPKLTINLYNPYDKDLYLIVNDDSEIIASVIGQTYSISQNNIVYNCVKLAKKSSCKIIILSGYDTAYNRSMNIIIEYPTSNIVPYTLTMNIADGINDNLTFNNHAAVYREIRQTIEAGGQIIVKGTATTNYMEADARSGTEVVLRYAAPRIDYVDNKNVVKISSYEIRINKDNYSTKALHNVLN